MSVIWGHQIDAHTSSACSLLAVDTTELFKGRGKAGRNGSSTQNSSGWKEEDDATSVNYLSICVLLNDAAGLSVAQIRRDWKAIERFQCWYPSWHLKNPDGIRSFCLCFEARLGLLCLTGALNCWKYLFLTCWAMFFGQLYKKNQMGGKSGDIGGHAIGAPRPIHQPDIVGRNGWYLPSPVRSKTAIISTLQPEKRKLRLQQPLKSKWLIFLLTTYR